MLLVIHNLPDKVRYSEVKKLIRERCGLTEIILDDLINESPQSYRVTVGLHDENESALLMKELNGLVFMGQKLFVENKRQQKQSSSNQLYSEGNMQQYEYGNNMASENMPVMQSMYTPSFNMPSNYIENMPSNQGSPYQFQPTLAQDSNSALMETQSTSTYNTVGGMYGVPNVAMMENTNMAYSCPPSFGNNQQQMVNSALPDFIPFTAEKSFNNYYNNDQSGSRYFQKKDDEQFTTFNNHQSFGRSAPDSSDRSTRTLPVSNKRESCDPSNRSNFPNERRFDDRNHSDDFSRRSDGGNSRQGDRNTIRGESFSDRNQRQGGEAYHRFYDGNYRENPGHKRFDDDLRHSDHRYNNRSNDGNSGRYVDDFSSHYDNSSMNADGNYNHYDDRSFEQRDNSRFVRINPKEKNESFRSYSERPKENERQSGFNRDYGRHKAGDNQRQETIYTLKHLPREQSYDFKRSRPVVNTESARNSIQKIAFKPSYDPRPKTQKPSTLTPETVKNRDESWRGMATSAIAKDLLKNSGMSHLPKKGCFNSFLKSIIRSRIDDLMGKRVLVPLNQILEEYRKRYRRNTQKAFLLKVTSDFEKTKSQQGHEKLFINFADDITTESNTNVEANGVKRAGTNTLKTNLAKKAKNNETAAISLQQKLPPPGPLPKYPNADKMEYRKIKRLTKKAYEEDGIFNLSSDLQKAVDNEVEIMCNLFTEECNKTDNEEEQKISPIIKNTAAAFKKVITVDLSKRILNVTCDLPLRVYTDKKLQRHEKDSLLKQFGIVSMRKPRGKRMYIASCLSYESYDRLCAMGTFDMDGCILTFRPFHMGGPPNKNKKNKNLNKQYSEHGEHAASQDYEGNDDEEDISDGDNASDGEDESDDEQNEDVKEVQSDNNDVEFIENNEDIICVDDDKANVEKETTDDPKSNEIDTKEKAGENNDSSKTVESDDNKKEESETQILLRDIKVLTETISNEENENNVNKNIKHTTDQIHNPNADANNPDDIDVDMDATNITQDDLEDF